MVDNPFEIPQQMRDLTEQNMKQAHAAYEQLMEFMTKAVDAWMGAVPANPMTAGFKDVQGRAVEIAKENGQSAFALVEKMTKAQNFQEVLTLQTQFAQERLQTFVAQTQQLFSLIGDALQKPERGAMGAEMAAAPADPVVTGSDVTAFKDEQDRAMEIPEKNAGPESGLVERIGDAQNFSAPSDNARPAEGDTPSGSSREKPPRRKLAKSKTETPDAISTPPPPSPTPLAPHRSPRSKPKAAKKEAAARRASLLKDK